ncbi:hypothetical protein Ahia01_000469200 [Argonauta hians]
MADFPSEAESKENIPRTSYIVVDDKVSDLEPPQSTTTMFTMQTVKLEKPCEMIRTSTSSSELHWESSENAWEDPYNNIGPDYCCISEEESESFEDVIKRKLFEDEEREREMREVREKKGPYRWKRCERHRDLDGSPMRKCYFSTGVDDKLHEDELVQLATERRNIRMGDESKQDELAQPSQQLDTTANTSETRTTDIASTSPKGDVSADSVPDIKDSLFLSDSDELMYSPISDIHTFISDAGKQTPQYRNLHTPIMDTEKFEYVNLMEEWKKHSPSLSTKHETRKEESKPSRSSDENKSVCSHGKGAIIKRVCERCGFAHACNENRSLNKVEACDFSVAREMQSENSPFTKERNPRSYVRYSLIKRVGDDSDCFNICDKCWGHACDNCKVQARSGKSEGTVVGEPRNLSMITEPSSENTSIRDVRDSPLTDDVKMKVLNPHPGTIYKNIKGKHRSSSSRTKSERSDVSESAYQSRTSRKGRRNFNPTGDGSVGSDDSESMSYRYPRNSSLESQLSRIIPDLQNLHKLLGRIYSRMLEREQAYPLCRTAATQTMKTEAKSKSPVNQASNDVPPSTQQTNPQSDTVREVGPNSPVSDTKPTPSNNGNDVQETTHNIPTLDINPNTVLELIQHNCLLGLMNNYWLGVLGSDHNLSGIMPNNPMGIVTAAMLSNNRNRSGMESSGSDTRPFTSKDKGSNSSSSS